MFDFCNTSGLDWPLRVDYCASQHRVIAQIHGKLGMMLLNIFDNRRLQFMFRRANVTLTSPS
jgi:hypothetical protein